MPRNIPPAYFELFEQVRRFHGISSVVPQQQRLGTAGLCINGAIFMALSRQQKLLLRLPPYRITELVNAGKGQPLVLKRRRPMREWLIAQEAHADALFLLVLEALSFVRSL